jgi:hypothetical protein
MTALTFNNDLMNKIKHGHKTQTRRPVKAGERLAWYFPRDVKTMPSPAVFTPSNRARWYMGCTRAIKPGRTAKGIGRVMITLIRRERVIDITEQDAIAEGFTDRQAQFHYVDNDNVLHEIRGPRASFFKRWCAMYGLKALEWECWVLDFILRSFRADLDFADHAAAMDFFNVAFQNPQAQYLVTPTDPEAARAWLAEYANMVNFSWRVSSKPFEERLAEAGPMRLNDVTDIDTLHGRNCGWGFCDREVDDENNGFLCDAPVAPGEDVMVSSETGKRFCHTWQCPVAWEANVAAIREFSPSLYESDFADCDDEETANDWMVLSARPRYAYVPNVMVEGVEEVWRR